MDTAKLTDEELQMCKKAFQQFDKDGELQLLLLLFLMLLLLCQHTCKGVLGYMLQALAP